MSAKEICNIRMEVRILFFSEGVMKLAADTMTGRLSPPSNSGLFPDAGVMLEC